jgi:hypothetical protein
MRHPVKQGRYVKEAGRTPIQINMVMTQVKLKHDASAVNCKLDELELETDKLNAHD